VGAGWRGRLSKNTARDRIVVYNILFCINGRRRPGDVAKCVTYRMLKCGLGGRTERWFGAQVFHLRDSIQTTPSPPPPGRGSRPPLCHCHYITRTSQWEWCEATAAARLLQKSEGNAKCNKPGFNTYLAQNVKFSACNMIKMCPSSRELM